MAATVSFERQKHIWQGSFRMADKEIRKSLKTIRQGIKELKKEYSKLEIRPCQNDMEIQIKEKELREIIDKIYALEKEQDRMILDSIRVS
jgi:glutamyl-tRNA reductase